MDYSLIGVTFFMTMLGGCMPAFQPGAARRSRIILSFCAGTFVGAVLFHMIPGVISLLGIFMMIPMICGFLGTYVVEWLLAARPAEGKDPVYHNTGLAALGAISFHSLLEGFAMGAALKMPVGLAIIAAIIVHKFPAALTLGCLFVEAGKFNRKTIVSLIFFFALTAPLGTLLSLSLFDSVDSYLLGAALAVSGGTFLYLAFFDFLPAVARQGKFGTTHSLSLCLGTLAMYFLRD